MWLADRDGAGGGVSGFSGPTVTWKAAVCCALRHGTDEPGIRGSGERAVHGGWSQGAGLIAGVQFTEIDLLPSILRCVISR